VFRLTNRVDPEFLWAMLYEAAFWRDSGEEERPALDDAKADRSFARYVEGWGREGDAALVALDRHDEAIGAAWYRTFAADDAGYGFISSEIPELSIGVYPEFRGSGLGSLLLGSLIVRARAHDVGALSLSVAADNPAHRLYLKLGFVDVAHDAGGSITMQLVIT
jgi:GNAT superfamily N-acetyltransferase